MKTSLATCLTYLLTLTHSDIDHPSDVIENTRFSDTTGESVNNTPQGKVARTGLELAARVVDKRAVEWDSHGQPDLMNADHGGIEKVHPAVRIACYALAQRKGLAGEFGMSPRVESRRGAVG